MKKLLLLATSATAYYLVKNKQKKKAKQKKQTASQQETATMKTVTPQNQESNTPDTDNPKTPLINDDFSLSGEYRWTFYLGPIKQVSNHIFSEDYIDYRMDGKAHSTNYRMHKVSYDAEQHKWIGKTDDDVVYVMFFKPKTDSDKLTFYKHKCAHGNDGIAEAIAFACPADGATADHGWNIYSKQGSDEPQDILPFAGEFVAVADDVDLKVSIADTHVTCSGKTYQKLTHHTGERRWVGQLDEEYLVVFYELGESNEEQKPVAISLSLQTYDDGEVAYQSKHGEQQYIEFK